jgi:hypothetical protein
MKSNLYNAIYDKFNGLDKKTLLLIEYEIKQSIEEEISVDMENFTSGLRADFEDAKLIIFENKTYTQANYLETVLEVIKDFLHKTT